MVGDVREGGAIAVGDAVAEGRTAVGDRLRPDLRRADLPLAGRRIPEVDRTGQLADLDGREGGGDVTADPLLQRRLGRGRPPDRDLRLRAEAGRKEHQALDVIEMEVG